ncbi:3383_t:CDS:2 [Paraglomus brasilianum]|uniref:3383_t:CDS:1 n=1 Tax=Paraglomus brasilianum TaxID=144538 RepID=A0A9N9H2S9_9GLOM|nr:3383_t:CDS:2 [Paraglomus brasilianum]
MVRKFIAALILLAMLSTLNAMQSPIFGQRLIWKECRDAIPLLTVQADMPVPGQNETVTISGKVPDKSAQYKWSFSYLDLEGKPIAPSYKGASVQREADEKNDKPKLVACATALVNKNIN